MSSAYARNWRRIPCSRRVSRTTNRVEDNAPREVSLSDYKDDDPIPSYKLKVNNYGKDERPVYNTFSVKESFTQSLMEQLGFQESDRASACRGGFHNRKPRRRRIISGGDIDSLVDDLAFRAGIESDEKEVLDMLHVIQEFEPAGGGGRET